MVVRPRGAAAVRVFLVQQLCAVVVGLTTRKVVDNERKALVNQRLIVMELRTNTLVDG